jgi:hypothetical protein
MEDNILQKYIKLNKSYKHQLIFHVGIKSGFFAEYTCMVNAMIFCLEHKLQFKLYSDDANFKYDKGWSDYFTPFCAIVHDIFHKKYNSDSIPPFSFLVRKSIEKRDLRLIKWKINCIRKGIIGTIIANIKYRKITFLGHSAKLDMNKYFQFPELGIEGDYKTIFKKMIDISWQLNDEVKREYNQLKDELNMPESYISCQIRGGDKITEAELLSPDYYASVIKKLNKGHNVFVLTDDYRIYEHVSKTYTDFNWYTLCDVNERGYVNSSFVNQKKESKKKQMFRFLSSIQIMLNSTFFIGSITTGPSLFLLKGKFPDIYPMDCSIEDFNKLISLYISERSSASFDYICGKNDAT